MFARDWSEWMLAEMAFDLYFDWVCIKESTFVANLAYLYPKVTFITWEIGVKLPPVNFAFCSQWIPPLTHEVWKCEILEVLFVAAQKPQFAKVLD
jgi:hypothetical protein